jgi:hypothetical protein
VNSSGYVEWAGANTATNSELLTTGYTDNAILSRSATTSPTGNTAVVFYPTLVLDYHRLQFGAPIAMVGATTISVYVKQIGSDYRVGINAATYAAASVIFSLVGAGSVVGAVGGTAPNRAATITKVTDDGWYRITLTGTYTALNSVFVFMASSTSTDTTGANFIGVASQGISIWGLQINPGSTAQTYYPTTTAAYYAPRFDYSPTNIGEPRGLLIEGQATNVATNSNALANAGGLTRTYPTGFISPDGTENSQRFTKTDATTPRYIYPTTSFTVPASTAYTASIWIKYDGYAFTTQIQSDTAIDWGGAWTAAFVIASGGITVGSRTGICSASTVTPYPNGWYRCTATITTGAAPTGLNPRFLIDVIGTTGVAVLVYGLQLEAGSGASSYIPTGASGVTRNAELCSMTGTNFSSWWNQTEGTAFIETVGMTKPTDLTYRAFTISQFNAVPYQIGATWIYDNSGFRITELASSATKHAVALKANDFAISNGTSTIRTGTGAFGSTYDRLTLGSYENTTAHMNGCIKRFKYYPTRLTNAQLQALTAP